jgi:hypothetical protein
MAGAKSCAELGLNGYANASGAVFPAGTPGRQSIGKQQLTLVLLLALLAGCATRPYHPVALNSAPFLQRTVSASVDGVSVSAAVPDARETLALTGLDLYPQEIQPIWLQVRNDTAHSVRVAHWSIDPYYFSPLEVAYMNRGGYSAEATAAMERWFHDTALPRQIPPGTTRSGLVYTHYMPGTKGFNLDIFGSGRSYNFTLFVPIPGFTADHMTVDFAGLYTADEVRDIDQAGLQRFLETELGCCSTNASGDAEGLPLNLAVVGSGPALRRALLRGGWYETAVESRQLDAARRQFHAGRPPDGTFIAARRDGAERVELRIWLAPLRLDGEPVWLVQAGYVLGAADSEHRFSPDVDNAARFVLQSFWYNQSLARLGFTRGLPVSTAASPRQDFSGDSYFSEGLRTVLFVPEAPRAMDEVEVIFRDRVQERSVSW